MLALGRAGDTSRPGGGGDEIVLRRPADPVGRVHRSKLRGPASPGRCKAQGSRFEACFRGRVRTRSPTVATRDHEAAFDDATHRVIGGGIIGTHAGDLISEISLAIEMGCDAVDIGKTIDPHPTLSESIGMAAEVFEGVCTDLPPVRKK
jgi:dihydrolipoamide dehydrogenase